MRSFAIVFAATAGCALAGCTPSAGQGAGSNLECAAMISAASRVVQHGKAEKDAELEKRALYAMMTHLNTYAIPKGLREREAFAELNALRGKLLKTRAPAEIMSRARRCADQIRQ